MVYELPAADGGGRYEIAGINERYHPEAAAQLAIMIKTGHHDAAEALARDTIAAYTDVVEHWTGHAWLEVFLRDCCFNRGPKGALRILQIALGVADDGKFGPVTHRALKVRAAFPERLLAALRQAREDYERRVAPPVGARAKFWPGLVSRWDKAAAFAKTFL